MIRRTVRWVDQRSGTAPFLRKTLRYLFPDHWSFLLGEVALYAFILLVATGVYLTFFFEPDTSKVIYHGSYAPLRGQEMSHAYQSVVNISLEVKAGLLIRQTHHWAADVFVAAIVLHLLRIFFTGAYRKPRDLTYYIGIVMLTLALLEAYIGYSMVDDLLSGMGLAIGYGVALSIPFFGANLAALIWGAPYPGDPSFWSRMYMAHILLFPVLIGLLLGVHLTLVALRHHTQFRRKRLQTQTRLIGVPTFPGQTPRSLGLMLCTFGVLFLLGGLVQINPIWLWGPFHVWSSTNGAQPDWYLGWLIGGLRLVPHWDFVIGDYTLVPNPFWGGVAFPLVVFGFLFAWPALERKVTGDRGWHNVLDRPRDAPWRTAIGLAMVAWVVMVQIAGSADRVYVMFGITYTSQLWAYRVAVWVVPLIVLAVAHRVCVELQRNDRVEAMRERAEEETAADAEAEAVV
ncbi:MAG TPA: cytochrome b N-terminal domain-containing protein [Gaiellaceae bacterium]|jgi:ubiquinol-cytochrome c reductase cytochrome b subunit|nr:cytochrome b N-terminal domain-containing protein [Gaiellaceae bacterium]